MKFEVPYGKGAWGLKQFRLRPNAIKFAREKKKEGIQVFGVLKVTNTSSQFIKWKDGRT